MAIHLFRRAAIPRPLTPGLALLRGLMGLAFGLAALGVPEARLETLLLLFGAYMLADGASALACGLRSARVGEPWLWLVLDGLVDIAAGLAALLLQAATPLVFALLAAFWAALAGIFLLTGAFEARPQPGRGWLGFAGGLSLAWGTGVMLWPMGGAMDVVHWLGAYALAFGVCFIALAAHLWWRDRPAQAGAAPAGQAS